MKERVLKLLQLHRKQIEQKEKDITAFETDPLLLFGRLQDDKYVIPSILEDADPALLTAYQAWQYPLVVQALTQRISLTPFTLGWNETLYPSPFYLLYNGYPVAELHPYLRLFDILPTQDIADRLKQYELVASEQIQVWEDLQGVTIRLQNPFIDVEEDNLVSTLKISVKRKKLQKEGVAQQQALLARYQGLVEETNRLMMQLEALSREENALQYDIERVYGQLAQHFPLKLQDAHTTLITEVQETIAKREAEAEVRVDALQKRALETEQF